MYPLPVEVEGVVTYCGMAAARHCLRWRAGGILEDFIPDVGQLELAYLPIMEWIIDPDVHGLLDHPGNTVYLPTHYGATVHTDAMT